MPSWLFLLLALVIAAGGLPSAASSHDPNSQSDWLVRSWQSDQGLIDNSIVGLAQTPDGYLWMAFNGGLTRFDGADFDDFFLQHIREARNRVVRTLHLDRRGRLWLSMSRGVLLCVRDDRIEVFTDREGLPRAPVTHMVEDEAGKMWFTIDGQLFRIRGGTVEAVAEIPGMPSEGGWQIANDIQGKLWCARGTRLGFLRDGSWQPCGNFQEDVRLLATARDGGVWACAESRVFRCREGREPEVNGPLPDPSQVRVLLEDHRGVLWIGGSGFGLKLLMAGRLESVPVSHPDVTCLLEDREGSLWVGTHGGGLNLVRSRGLEMVSNQSDRPSQAVRSVSQDARGEVWAALQNGKLVHGRGSDWTTVGAENGWLGGDATCVFGGREGVWVGTRDRGLQQLRFDSKPRWTQQAGLESVWVRSLLETSKGDLLIATGGPNRLWLLRDGRLQALAMPVEVRVIRAMAEGADGTAWAGTSDGHLLRIAGDRVAREEIPIDPAGSSIRTLHATADGSLWVGYAGAGIGRLCNGRYVRVSTTKGLLDDSISQILHDDRGGLWAFSNRGLFRVNLKELLAVTEGRASRVRSVLYGRNEGLPSLQPTFDVSPRAWRTSDGELWFATRNGLLRVQPDRIPDNPVPPPVTLQSVMVDDRVVGSDDSRFPLRPSAPMSWMDLRTPNPSLRLAADHRKLEFQFAALSFSSVENVHFRYRLNGFDGEWIEAGTQRRAIYPRLSPGEYRFDVIACNDAGVWNTTGRQLSFTVLPFFWQTWWFRLLTIVVFTGGVVGLVRYVSFRRLRAEVRRLEAQTALLKDRARIAKDIHDDLGGSLTQIGLLSQLALQDRSSPDHAGEHVGQIAGVARQMVKSLDEIVWAVNPRNDTLPDLISYLAQYAAEFLQPAGIRCHLELPDHPPARPVGAEARHNLFLAVKEALTNVVRHSRATEVRFEVALSDAGLDVRIADDGTGIREASGAPLADGLRNMRQRMEDVGGSFNVESRPGGGTCLFFVLPLKDPN